jgi:hypothetical protein
MILEVLMVAIIHGNTNNHINNIVPGKSSNELALEADELRNRRLIAVKSKVVQTTPDRSGVKEEIFKQASVRWGYEEALDVLWIVNNESGFQQYIKNRNCCGLFQRLNRCSDDILSDLDGQISEGLDYIAERYDNSPAQARYFWENNHWY